MPELRIAPDPGGGGVPEPRKEDSLKCLGGEAESLNRKSSWSLMVRGGSCKATRGVAGIENKCSWTALLEGREGWRERRGWGCISFFYIKHSLHH